jgi:hypothetical protein
MTGEQDKILQLRTLAARLRGYAGETALEIFRTNSMPWPTNWKTRHCVPKIRRSDTLRSPPRNTGAHPGIETPETKKARSDPRLF